MKIKLDIDMEEYNGSTMLEQVEIKLADRIYDDIFKKIDELIAERVIERMDAYLNEKLEDMMLQPIKFTDEYGKEKESRILRDMMVDEAAKFLTLTVDDRGHTTSNYGPHKTRLEWIADKASKDFITKDLKAKCDQAVKQIRDSLDDKVKDVLLHSIKQVCGKQLNSSSESTFSF